VNPETTGSSAETTVPPDEHEARSGVLRVAAYTGPTGEGDDGETRDDERS